MARSTKHDYAQADRLTSLPQVSGEPIYVYRLTRPVRTHDLVVAEGPGEWIVRHLLRRPARPHLAEISRTESVLLLVRVDGRGRVDRFGFVGDSPD